MIRAQPWIVGQVLIFVALVISHLLLRRQLLQATRHAAEARLQELAQVRRTADALLKETARIAQLVHEESIERSALASESLDVKMDAMLAKFDVIGARQVDVSNTVQATNDVLARELDHGHSTEKTMRTQIDNIEESTTDTNRRLRKEKP